MQTIFFTSKGGCLEYFLKTTFDLKQFTVIKMAADHTGEVRLETGNIVSDQAFISEQGEMRQEIGNIIGSSFNNNSSFSLHDQKTDDIKPNSQCMRIRR